MQYRVRERAHMRRPPPDQCQLLHLPEDLLIRALSKWPAASLANLCVTCRELYALLGPAVDAAVARLGLELPRQCDRSTDHTLGGVDSLTRRLNFLQLLRASPASPRARLRRVAGADDDGAATGTVGVIDAVTPTAIRPSSTTGAAAASRASTPCWPPVRAPRGPIREVAASDAPACSCRRRTTRSTRGARTTAAARPRRHRAAPPCASGCAHRCAQVACGRPPPRPPTAGDVFSFGRGSLGRLDWGRPATSTRRSSSPARVPTPLRRARPSRPSRASCASPRASFTRWPSPRAVTSSRGARAPTAGSATATR